MNKKGFTLVELLATIAILVIMSVIIGVNITSILNSTKQNKSEFNKEQIEKAACVFVDSDTICEESKYSAKCGNGNGLTVRDLVETGLLDEVTYKDDLNKTISVTRTNGQKKCTYNG